MTKINKYQDKNGNTLYKFRFYAGIDELTGKKRYVKRQGFNDLKTAKTELAKVEYLVNSGQYYKDITKGKFEDVLNEWLVLHETRVKPSTFYNIKLRVKNYVLPYFRGMYIDKITLRHCQDFTNTVYQSAPKAYKHIISIARNTLDYALRLGMIDNNPMAYVIKPKAVQAVKNEHENYYNRDELNKFLTTAKKDNLKYYALFRLLAYSGMRIGEVLALTWDDVDLENNTVTINKTQARTRNGLTVQTPKTQASNRVISLDTMTISILKSWKHEQKKELFILGFNALASDQLVFSNSKNKMINNTVIASKLKKIAQQAGIYCITLHGFRHTHASLLFNAGVDIKQVQARLGHSKVQTTLDIYTHVVKNKADKVADKFAEYVNSN